MNFNMKFSVKLIKFMIFTILITLKSQIHDFHFTSSSDALTQSVYHIKKSLKKELLLTLSF